MYPNAEEIIASYRSKTRQPRDSMQSRLKFASMKVVYA
jgi:hypothetical protein